MFIKALLFFCLATEAWAQPWDLSLRYRSPAYRNAVLDQGVLAVLSPTPWLDLQLGARLSQSSWQAHGWGYLLELSTPRRYFISANARLFHWMNRADDLSTSQILLHGQLSVPVTFFLEAFLDMGWFTQRTVLSSALVFPQLGSPLRSDNWAAKVGLRGYFSERWSATVLLANFDEFESYNLNYPFLQSELSFQHHGRLYTFFGRYQMALGFGRLAEFLLGFRLRFDLERLPTADWQGEALG